MRALSSARDVVRRGFATHVFLAARLERRDAAQPAGLKAELRRPGLGKQLIVANVAKMRKLVARLDWRPPEGAWTSYGERNSYTDEDATRKDHFVRSVAGSAKWRLVWDIGCNTGRHSRIAAEHAGLVVGFDADPAPVELLYRELRGDRRILPLIVDAADPSPALGWRGTERKTLLERGRPDLVLALALVHHLAIGRNIPIRDIIEWLASLGGALVVEFPTREDPMVQKLLAAKREGLHADYRREVFEQCLHDAFDVARTEPLGSGTRVLYFATVRTSGAPTGLLGHRA
jgi:SAM-dependent methyltransferase